MARSIPQQPYRYAADNINSSSQDNEQTTPVNLVITSLTDRAGQDSTTGDNSADNTGANPGLLTGGTLMSGQLGMVSLPQARVTKTNQRRERSSCACTHPVETKYIYIYKPRFQKRYVDCKVRREERTDLICLCCEVTWA